MLQSIMSLSKKASITCNLLYIMPADNMNLHFDVSINFYQFQF